MRSLPQWPALLVVTVAMVLGTTCSPVYGLATEQFGNGPVNFAFSAGVLKIVNRASRVYWYEVNGNPYFFFHGNAADVNEALALFAALPDAKKEVILFAGPGETRSLQRRVVTYDWSLHLPQGIRFTRGEMADTRATLVIHITRPRPGPVDAAKVKRLLSQLDDPHFRVREAARKELAPLTRAAEPLLRQALQDHPSLERRRQIQQLLDQMRGISVNQLKVPKDLSVIDREDLKARYLRALASRDPQVRGMASLALAGLPDTAIALKRLEKALHAETDEYTLRCLASAFAELGAGARPALPLLEEVAKRPDKSVAQAFEQAIKMIRAAQPRSADHEQTQAIQQEIASYCKQRRAKHAS